jgi:hypothetical protein
VNRIRICKIRVSGSGFARSEFPDPEREGSGFDFPENRIGGSLNLRFCLPFGLFDTSTRFTLLCSLHRIPGTIHESLLRCFITFEHLRGIFRTTRVPTRIFGAAAGDSKAKWSRENPVSGFERSGLEDPDLKIRVGRSGFEDPS